MKRTDTTASLAKISAAGCLLGFVGGVATRAVTGGTFGSTSVGPDMLFISADEYGRLTEATEMPRGWK